LWGQWQKDPTISPINSWTRRSPSAITASPQASHAVNSATPPRMCGALSRQSCYRLTPERVAPIKSFDYGTIGQYWISRSYGRMVDFKGESGTMDILLTIPTSFAMSMVAGLGCLCALSSVFTTKTSGVQHQIQDALVVFVGQLNLVLLLFCL